MRVRQHLTSRGVALLLALVVLPGPAPAKDKRTKPPPLDATTRDFDQTHLDIAVQPDLEKGTVEGHVRIRFAALRNGFDMLRLHAKDMVIQSITCPEGRPLAFTLQQGVLAIRLAQALNKGASGEVSISYRATPTRGLFFHRPSEAYPSRPLFLYSQGQGNENRRWIPCYDLPDERSSWRLTARVPAELTTVSNGTREGSTAHEDGTRTDVWAFSGRAPTYLISLVAGRLKTVTSTWGETTLEFNGPPDREEELRVSLAQTAKMMAFFGEYLEAPYPWARYAQTYVWDFIYGGMENVTATTLNMRALHQKQVQPNYRADGLVAHELAHMWFGDLITCRTWSHIWLNEGFATYFTDLFFEHYYGRDSFLLRRRNQNRGYMDKNKEPETLGLKRDPRGDTPIELSGGKAYSRGSAILHMLRRELGDETFRRAIAAHVAKHRDDTVVSEALRHVVEDVSGRPLRWFWDQWVYGAGYPRLDVRVDRAARVLRIRQMQPARGGQQLFRITVPVRWGPEGKARNLRIYRERHAIPLGDEELDARYLRFGVHGDLLMRAEVHQPPDAWAELLLNDPDFTGRMDATEALEASGEVVVPVLTRALAHDAAWGARQRIAEVLGAIGGQEAGIALVKALGDADSRVRETVARALGSFSRATAGEALLKALADSEEHPYVRGAAAESAGRLKVEGAFEAMRELLGADDLVDRVRGGALTGLKALGDPRGLDIALPYLAYSWGRGGNHRLRQTALACVTRLGPDDPRVHKALTELLGDPYHRMRQWAAAACGTYAVKAAIPALRQLSKSDWHGGTKSAAKKALQTLAPADTPTKDKTHGS